jgi:hypothetical protein
MKFVTFIGKPVYSNKGYGNTDRIFEGNFQAFYGKAFGEPLFLNRMNEEHWGWHLDNPNGSSKEFAVSKVRDSLVLFGYLMEKFSVRKILRGFIYF